LSVKIGGCEAISDINRCIDLNVDGIVAPMVESRFALQKFSESINKLPYDGNKFINIESQQAYNNLNDILESPTSKMLSGIVVGRSDLTKSFGYGKQDVMSSEICKVVTHILQESKKLGLKTYMGGNIGTQSIEFIQELFKKEILDCIETRNVILSLDESNINDLNTIISLMLEWESLWLESKASHYNRFSTEYNTRSKEIQDRL
jgi:citrate lyase beta subunit